MEKREMDQILKEAFQSLPSNSKAGQSVARTPKPESLIQAVLKSPPLPSEPEMKFLEALLPAAPFPKAELFASNKLLSFSLPPEERMNLFEHLPKDLIVPAPPRTPALKPLLPPPPLEAHFVLEKTAHPEPPAAPAPEQKTSQHPLIPSALADTPTPAPSPSFIPSPQLPILPSLQDLDTVSYSDAFETELVFLPKEEGGAIFALTLIPRQDMNLTAIRQNYFFLIDKSNSVQRDRLMAVKSAVQKALEELDSSDTFNIIVFDSKIEKLSQSLLSPTKESLAKAKAFLENIELGSFFAQSDLFKSLFLTVPAVAKEDELYTAILLTDGESLGKKGAVHSLLNDWTRYNDGRVSLFAVAMTSDHQLPALDALSAFNRGKVFTSPTKRGIKRKLLKAMKTVHDPVAKNLSVRAICRAPQGKIEIFPIGIQTPHLYLNEPYVIVGETDSMDDFILFVQGRLNGEWLHIKKTISFMSAKKGGAGLKGEWALQKAYQLYDRYLTDENPKHIAEAKALLEPHELSTPFY